MKEIKKTLSTVIPMNIVYKARQPGLEPSLACIALDIDVVCARFGHFLRSFYWFITGPI